MKIVILDAYALNPGDLSWDQMSSLGDTIIYDRTPPELILVRSEGAQILIVNKTKMTREVINLLPELKYIGVLATGYDVVDTVTASERGIIVANVPAYSTDSVVQMVFALLFELCTNVKAHSDAVHQMEWSKNADFSFRKSSLTEIAGKTIGIIGFGKIGQKVAQVAEAFGMNVLVYSRTKVEGASVGTSASAGASSGASAGLGASAAVSSSAGASADSGASSGSGASAAVSSSAGTSESTGAGSGATDVKWVSLEEIFKQSDVLTIHCPLNDSTKGIINKATLKLMKPSAVLINTARGGVIVEQDVADAMNEGVIAGAGVDVLSTEPPKEDNPMLTAKNCIITPHIAWATNEARQRLMNIAVSNVKAFIEGNPVNKVN